jgi:hypothetical protein
MSNFITKARVVLLDGIIDSDIQFQGEFNILAGENGTLKTKILAYLKATPSAITKNDPDAPLRLEAISPKRNLELKTTEQILHSLRQTDRTMAKLINELTALKIDDKTFPRYPSFGELFYLAFDDARRSGGNQEEAMGKVRDEFNAVLTQIFENYSINAEWDSEKGTPRLSIRKNAGSPIPLDGLSLGESEVLAVVLNLYASRDSYDVYLIDEPENHLNWHLETKLFSFFAGFCKQYNKQLIVATHSRAVFQSQFLDSAQFLEWTEGGRIVIREAPTEEIRERLAGEAISVIKLGEFLRATFFVEDRCQEQVIEELKKILGVHVDITKCGNASIVKVVYQYSLQEGGWKNAYFVVDGDNQGNPYPDDLQFIHLDTYCVENYLIYPDVAAAVCGTTPDHIRQLLLNAILQKKSKILHNYKWLSFLLDRLAAADLNTDVLARIDASELLPTVLKKYSITLDKYVGDYVRKCEELGRLDEVFPANLLNALRRSQDILEVR